jgi:putative chitinase
MADALMTFAQFGNMVPKATRQVREAWYPALITEFRLSEIVTDVRQAAIMASCINESGGFTRFDEMTYFNTPFSRIRQIFAGVYGLTEELVRSWKALGQQGFDVAFFNHVYADANRPPGYRLGNTIAGDGHRFRGMGPGQLTGRGNYAWMQNITGIPLVDDPESIKRPEIGAKITCFFWRKHGLNQAVDDGSESGFLYAMRRMNAGLQDFSHHLAYWKMTTAIMAQDQIPPLPAWIDPLARKEQIKGVQRALTEKGFNTFGVDGIWGGNSTAALKRF